MNKTKWIIFAVVVLALFGGIIWVSKSNQKTFTGDANKVVTEGAIADHVRGNKDAKVTMIEYGDFQCPACGGMYQPVKQFEAKYGDKVAFVFRDYPLTSLHPNALAAATAAEAAGLQGKFFEMHDMLYENQDSWADVAVDKREDTFVNYAKMIGLDETKFRNDLKSKDVSDKIARDRAAGGKIGADSTPTFVVAGEKISGNNNVDKDFLDQKLADAIAAAYPANATQSRPKNQ